MKKLMILGIITMTIPLFAGAELESVAEEPSEGAKMVCDMMEERFTEIINGGNLDGNCYDTAEFAPLFINGGLDEDVVHKRCRGYKDEVISMFEQANNICEEYIKNR